MPEEEMTLEECQEIVNLTTSGAALFVFLLAEQLQQIDLTPQTIDVLTQSLLSRIQDTSPEFHEAEIALATQMTQHLKNYLK